MGSTVGPGSVIAGRYRLDVQLGQGGMGSVWRAEHLALRSPVAVKLIDPEIAGRPETLERFQAEAQAAASLRSPHVVQILDYGVDASVPYIVMEMLEGQSLADRLAMVGRLPHADLARIVLDVARALTRAHEAGIVHRDLKPENVFLVRNDDQDVAKVLDFGIAKTARPGLPSAKGPTRTGNILGTPGYMSPEQAQGTKAVDHRSDLWSLGVIVFECVVGRVPFDSEALGDLLLKICANPLPVPSQVAPVPPGFDAWFARACCRDVDARFQTARELAEALRLVLAPDLDRGSATISVATLAAAVGGGMASAVTLEAPAAASSKGAVAANTVPGISLTASSGSRRSAGAYIAAALALVMLGSGVTWLALTGRLGKGAATAAMITTAVPSVTAAAPPASVTPTAEPTVHVGGDSQTATPPPPSVTPASSPPEPTPTATASAAAKATKPPHVTPPPPPRRGGGGDQRLGF